MGFPRGLRRTRGLPNDATVTWQVSAVGGQTPYPLDSVSIDQVAG
jgi:hypothetical protein